ncbi:phosphotransferase enzyme family protein [Phaeovulum vinaykumarii]|uniref:Ser/Thr protein kinase RdoA involved in Cpx stress response, MazF antagonist n=1 Tax=Phaeovulum vinaykumarii TaxID=407234 RepID=A0A1N7KB95_9RHOB|nr:phosphotransferase [Phaeovulum vinaykumarii]SIS58823.1 Ser/Thr protein kinase RdoA involved in Cpx stress response, MazF antagonist [Phaeovulum vinaykumarii]SOB93931.1 Ser/Thr protein kinase RdoA (MazF antagonist) [Phaeovulum vinaykumarii]
MTAPVSDPLLAAADAVLAAWGGALEPPRLITMRENVVLAARLTSGAEVALRLHRPGYQDCAAITSELTWCAALAEAGAPVPRPVPTCAGGFTAPVPGAERWASCVEWRAGAAIGRGDRPLPGDRAEQVALMHDLGAAIARLHALSDVWVPPPGFVRPAWDAAALLGPAPRWGRFWENPALGAQGRACVLEAATRARTALAEGERDWGLIHADILRENVLRGPEGLVLIDFDDAGFGWRSHDLATALIQSLEEPALPELAMALLAGYAAGGRAAPPVSELALFVMLRAFASAGWVLSRAGADDARVALYAGRAERLARAYLDGCLPWEDPR